ncbi:DMT family transporter [Kitasatospora brasiliensis]|uniref:DMT family transporter n=1 Tax=Kitasatospora brasiliensis TaxID=3058040 RepID=UPI00293076FE|nr:DMT family transporter [Kitasatospora sp. K002]
MAVFLLALSAACCLGLGFVLQQHAAQQAPRSDMLRWRLLLDLMRMPQWLLGTGFMVSGLILSALALNQGEVSLVEPLLATNLIFAMALARVLTRQTLGRSGWGGVLLLALGVTAFIVAGQPTGGGPPAGELRHWLVVGTVVGLVLLLVSMARRLPLFEEATLLALAAGLLYGLQDALTRTTTQRFDHEGLSAVLRSWQPYAVVVAGVVGLLLVQSAFEAAPLRMSLPALTAAQPLSGIACAVGFLGDRLRVTPGALAWQSIGLLAIVTGVIVIGRHPAMPGTVRDTLEGIGTLPEDQTADNPAEDTAEQAPDDPGDRPTGGSEEDGRPGSTG